MENKIQVNLMYYGIGLNKNFDEDFKNSSEFISSLSSDFDIKIERKQGGLGGGIYNFIIEFYINHPILSSIVINVGSNFLYSLLKNQFKAFIESLKKLENENKGWNSLDVCRIKLEFEDVGIFIYINDFQTLDSKIYFLVQEIINAIPVIALLSKNKIKEIHVPVVRNSLLSSEMGFNTTYTLPTMVGYQEIDPTIDFYCDWGIIFRAERDKSVYNSETKTLLKFDWINFSETYS